MDLQEAMTAGVFVDFRDAHGNSVGQAVFFEWRGRALPSVGDSICCQAVRSSEAHSDKLRGRVCSRHFELQVQDDGEPCVWVRLVVDAAVAAPPVLAARSRVPRAGARFSQN
jgi:hypothetical protein